MMDMAVVKKVALTFLLLAGVVALPLALDATTPASALPAPMTGNACDGSVVVEPEAPTCLLIPQCSRNSDCDALCGGPRLGRCVHNDCPARVCTCR